MRKTFRVVPMLLALTGLLSATFAAPAAAVVDAADYVLWLFPSPGPRGLGQIHDGASNTMIFAETVGLRPNTRYRIVGSAAFCGDVHQPIHQIWRTGFRSNAQGAAFTNTTFDDDAVVPTLKSVRLFQGSSQVDCAKPLPYQSDGGGAPTDAFAMLNAFGARAMVFVDLGAGNDKLTVVGHGFIASHGYRLLGSDVTCPNQPSAGTTLFEKVGTTNARGVVWRSDTGTNFGTEPPKSIQLFNGSTRVACADTTMLPAVQ